METTRISEVKDAGADRTTIISYNSMTFPMNHGCGCNPCRSIVARMTLTNAP